MPQAKLSTHVLDTMHGCPAGGMRVDLFSVVRDGEKVLLKSVTLNEDGRNGEGPLLQGESLIVGCYELHFHVGDYFAKKTGDTSAVRFLNVVPVCFGIPDSTQGYHVPLLCTPWAYSTYRGS